MSGSTVAVEEEIASASMGRPHVVILGSGASRAAFPKREKTGRLLPVMDDLVEVLRLQKDFESYGVSTQRTNFEELYSELAARADLSTLRETVESRVRNYFGQLELPDTATLYDHLVLSLRPKDVIATFNWDPFLFDACVRNCAFAKPPHVLFLHGNVRVGFCSEDQKPGFVHSICPTCGGTFKPSKLLYPIRDKNYTDDPFVKNEWQKLRGALKHAYVFTVFGYSAPTSDVKAVESMKEAWGSPSARSLEQIEIIDIKNDDVLSATWSPFILRDHYQTRSDFYDSLIATHPRRTCEAVWDQLMEIRVHSENRIPREKGFADLYEWFAPLVTAERQHAESGAKPKTQAG